MGILDFILKWFGSKQETSKQEQKKEENMKIKNKNTNNDKGFHPEILFLINRPYAEYVDFIEVK